MKILIVDDKPDNLYMLESLLKGSGFHTQTARNGAEALGLARMEKPGLIITDILMPVMDGYTLCRELKKDEKLNDIPIIFYTATYTDPKDEEFAMNLGADRFILKPADPDVFIEIIQHIFENVPKKRRTTNEIVFDSDMVVLKEYNQTLIRKLEDKMRQTDENEKTLKKYIDELEANIEQRKQTEKLLSEAEARFRSIFEDTVLGLYRSSKDGKILLANPALVKMLGYNSLDELLTRDLSIQGFDSQTPRLHFLELIENNNEIIGLESKWVKADGSTIYVRESAKGIRDENNEILYFEGVVEDVTQQKLTIIELDKVESKYRALFLNANDAILLMDKDTFIDCNPKAEMMFGCSSSVLLRTKPIDFSPDKQPDGSDSMTKSLEKINLALSGIPQFFEWQHKRKDGTVFDAEVSLNSIVFGEKTYIQAMVRDVSDRKKAEKELSDSENQFRSVWEKSFDGMRLVNESGIITLVNTAFCEIIGLKKSELIGKPTSVFYAENERERIQASIIKNIKETNIEPSIEKFVTLYDNRKIWLEISNSFIEIGSSKLLLSIIRDITHHKEMIAELIAAKEKAEEMNRVKSYFFANMSHELRTPLIGILGYSELLQDYLSDKEEIFQMAETIHSSGMRLMDTLNNILTISKIEAEKVEYKLKDLDIIPVINNVIRLFTPTAKYARINILSYYESEIVYCYADSNLFKEIMNNLISNAIKFSNHNDVTVVVKKDGKKSIIKIIDHGIGIPKDKQDIIWEAFRQVSEGLGRGFEGTGLGLTISKKYCEYLKGSIYFESEEGKGTTFTVELPLSDNNDI